MSTLDTLRWDAGHPTILETDWNRLLRLLERGGVVKTSSYIIWTDGTTIRAVNGTTGVVDYQGVVANTVIQAAIDALATVDGGLISFRQGTYTLTASLTIITENISLRGENRGNTIIDGDALGDYAIKIGDGVVDINPGPRISSLFVKGGIEVRGHNVAGTDLGVHSIWFQDLRLESSSRYGIRILNYHTQPSTIRDCVIADCELGGIYIDGDTVGVYIQDNMFGRNKVNDIEVVRNAYGRPRGLVIKNNMFEHFTVATPGRAIYLYAVDGVWIINNHIINTMDATLDGIYVTGLIGDAAWWSIRCFINDNWIVQDDVANIRHGINIEATQTSSIMRNNIALAGNNSINTERSTTNLRIAQNSVIQPIVITGTPLYVRANQGFNPVGVIATAWSNVDFTFGLPTPGGANPTDANQDYVCRGIDCNMLVSGGTGVDVMLQDPSSVTIVTYGATPVFIPNIPIGYIVNFGNFTVPPVCVVSGN